MSPTAVPGSPPTSPTPLVLVGLMGAGKSTVGAAVADRTDRRFVDLDAHVEAGAQASVAEIFAAHGEAHFRALEADALAEVLASEVGVVVATGGGVVTDPRSAKLLGAVPQVVWLRARPETLADRVGDGAGRPLLATGALETLRRLSIDRAPAYARVATSVVDVDDLDVDQVVAAVVDACGAQGPG